MVNYTNNDILKHFSFGNSKLKSTKQVQYMVFNLPAVKTCPFRTKDCERFCYARKAEKMYPSVLPFREKNLEFSKSENFADIVVNMIISKYEKSCRKTNKKLVVRVHESGDFYNLEYYLKWYDIVQNIDAYNVATGSNILIQGYTKSVSYLRLKNINTFDCAIFRGSIDASSDDYTKQLINEFSMPTYTATYTPNEKHALCRCSDCATCQKCYTKKYMHIDCIIH